MNPTNLSGLWNVWARFLIVLRCHRKKCLNEGKM